MGQPLWSKDHKSYDEYIVIRGERRELKHLSTCRRRKKVIDFLSSGERKGKSLNQRLRLLGLRDCNSGKNQVRRRAWEGPPKNVRVV